MNWPPSCSGSAEPETALSGRGTAPSGVLLALFALLFTSNLLWAASHQARLEQLLSQLGRKLDSDTAMSIDDSHNDEARRFIVRANELYNRAADALYSDRLEQAEESVQAGLRAYQTALDTFANANKTPEQLAAENSVLLAEIDAYHQGYKAALAERGPSAAGVLNEEELNSSLSQARKLEDEGQHQQAQSLLRQAQQELAEALTKLRNNETLVYSRDFRTPADEYRYEHDRYSGFVELAHKLADEIDLEQMKIKLYRQFFEQARQLAEVAGKKASRGEYEAAIGEMETANKRLVRALQILGLPVSY